ncbi:hypothetical protein ACJRO7_012191 [Eucalyptus globulus]|uniref:non-specific serine/threonine protein kinase n=1 Tax=Eucalyptus globulus TaxID=34317 RepID=A0ABD3LHR5_EUCGL
MGPHCTHTQGLVCMAFCIFLISILGDPITSSLDEVSYEECKPRSCGGNRRLNISYPFYIHGEGRDLCGYPGFDITCERTKPTYARYSDKNFAPRPFTFTPVNIFLNNSVSLPRTLKFFYNCTGPFSFPFPTSPVSCPSTYNSSVALLPNDTFHLQSEPCGSYSMVPNGFRLKWDILTKKSCTGCRESKGRCGRSRDTDFLCYCPNGTNHPLICNSDGKLKTRSLLKKGALDASTGAFGVAIIVLAYLCQQKISKQKSMIIGSRKMKKGHKFEVIFENHGIFMATRYSYADIKRMTNPFKEKLDKGGYGCVYKGKLPDGHLVAVKILSKLKGDGEDFINEVNSMGRNSHVNIVKLLGFCLHKIKRAIVYEYMPNRSLEKLIYEENYFKLGCGHLGWDTLYQISLSMAQGLENLHKGHNSRILHFDMKPHNILLDENYYPKISNFGLAKICHREEHNLTTWSMRDCWTDRARSILQEHWRNIPKIQLEKASEIYFPHWIHKCPGLQEELGLQNVASEGDREKTEKMVIVGLWCI